MSNNAAKVKYFHHLDGWRKFKEHIKKTRDGNVLTKSCIDVYEYFVKLWNRDYHFDTLFFEKQTLLKEVKVKPNTYCRCIKRLEYLGLISVQPYSNGKTFSAFCAITPLDVFYDKWVEEYNIVNEKAKAKKGEKGFVLIDFEGIKLAAEKGLRTKKARVVWKQNETQNTPSPPPSPQPQEADENEPTQEQIAAYRAMLNAKVPQHIQDQIDEMLNRHNAPAGEEETPVADEPVQELTAEEKTAYLICSAMNEQLKREGLKTFKATDTQLQAVIELQNMSVQMEQVLVQNIQRWLANADDNLKDNFKPTILVPHYWCEILNLERQKLYLPHINITEQQRRAMVQVEKLCAGENIAVMDFITQIAPKLAKTDKNKKEIFEPAYMVGTWFRGWLKDYLNKSYIDNPHTLANGVPIPLTGWTKESIKEFNMANLVGKKGTEKDAEKCQKIWNDDGMFFVVGKGWTRT